MHPVIPGARKAGDNVPPMAIGFPPRYETTINLNLRVEDMAALVIETLAELGWKYEKDDERTYHARTSVSTSLRGGGWESVSISIEEYAGITIKSQSLLPLPFFDFGKNKENVEVFVEAMSMKSL